MMIDDAMITHATMVKAYERRDGELFLYMFLDYPIFVFFANNRAKMIAFPLKIRIFSGKIHYGIPPFTYTRL
jgi:hypothetical protein